MQNVTERTSNPFGMRPPRFVDADRGAVYDYGDANADFHLVGHYPGEHGGRETGVPFTGAPGTRRLQGVLADLGFLSDVDSDAPQPSNLYASYLHMSATPGDREPTAEEYQRLEPFFDAGLRAVNAHILLPVGATAYRHTLREYTTRARKEPAIEDAHATQIRGRGFLVVPVANPEDWSDADDAALRDTLAAILDSDYRQTKGVATLIG